MNAFPLRWLLVAAAVLVPCPSAISAEPAAPRSEPVADVLRQPLPAENLTLVEQPEAFVVTGPTFVYKVDRGTGLIAALDVRRDGKTVLATAAPQSLRFDDYVLSRDGAKAETTVASANAGKVVFNTTGELKGSPPLPFALETTFFSDGVVVTRVTIISATTATRGAGCCRCRQSASGPRWRRPRLVCRR
jgi:hypothetical protein